MKEYLERLETAILRNTDKSWRMAPAVLEELSELFRYFDERLHQCISYYGETESLLEEIENAREQIDIMIKEHEEGY